MLYNTLQFLLFYIIITMLYWWLPHKHRWLLLLAGSCFFYMSFVPVYLFILGFTIVVDYLAGIYIEKTIDSKKRKWLLILSLVANIGVLALFKYYNFLNGLLDKLLAITHQHSPLPWLQILLPIGLSFHTFQAMSYTIEVYRGKQKAEKHFGIYALYVMFYPQLVAGPIERPQHMLWQFHTHFNYDFEKLKSGLAQMAFGLFKKVVIADRIAVIVDRAYADPAAQNGTTFLIVTLLYSFQIYCDFSGYTDIGIGAAKTMGFTLMDNFKTPYLSASFGKFWSRWHISLSTWFKDYLYIPLGGNRVRRIRKYCNLMIVFLVSGLWHGANLTFLVWGFMHGILLLMENLKNDLTLKMKMRLPANWLTTAARIVFVFVLVSLAWVFFRSPSISTASSILQKIFSPSLLGGFNYTLAGRPILLFTLLLITGILIKEYYLPVIPTKKTWLFFIVFGSILTACYLFGVFNNEQFIYFQF